MKTDRDIEKENQMKLLQSAVDYLREHFDSVQIVCTQEWSGCVSHYSKGSGNWYARMHSMQEMLYRDEAMTKRDAVGESSSGSDDADSWQFL